MRLPCKICTMPPALLQTVDQDLLSGAEYKNAIAFAAEHGYTISSANLSTHRHRHLLPKVAEVAHPQGEPQLMLMDDYFKKLMSFTQELTLAQAALVRGQQNDRGVIAKDVDIFINLARFSLDLKTSARFHRLEEESRSEESNVLPFFAEVDAIEQNL